MSRRYIRRDGPQRRSTVRTYYLLKYKTRRPSHRSPLLLARWLHPVHPATVRSKAHRSPQSQIDHARRSQEQIEASARQWSVFLLPPSCHSQSISESRSTFLSSPDFKQSHFDLKWAPPVESTPQNIEFTPNVTPTTFTDDTPPLLQPATAYIFPPEEEAFANENPKPRGRKGSGYIPRPPNAFILFRSSFIKSQHVTSDVETNHSTLSKIIGMTWQNLPNGERQAWHLKAKEAQEEHKRRWPQYSFRPVTNKAQKKKRRVRETEPKDIKRCEKIVELLCNGKKGDELKHAVKDFDKSHVPEFITRFEAPITERAYRRSSSAPLPDTDYEQGRQSFRPSALPHRKRSSSVEPEDLASTAEIKLPMSGLSHFDSVLPLDSSPSTPGHSTPGPHTEGYIVSPFSQFNHFTCISGALAF